MGRPRTPAGEIGQIQITVLANGRWRARARMRDDAGALVQLRVDGPSEEAARAELQSKATALTTHSKALVTGASTIAEAAAAWLPTASRCCRPAAV